ncbi:hypothetical protein MHF_0340 [Mycoplasma haemofelis Ohio2]|uniref:Uncharacterized protein n=1 Tax=Mycoplasma haemofelis (strain Ohio2) TaxID=859194 RepID=F6FGU6_MYCHI|nr:hypothetical protein MHF_0340 [Mycoplasma haemofelis Ohio2]
MHKGFLALGGVGAAGATATGVALNKEKIFGSKETYSISQLLNKEHLILISSDENDAWTKKWDEYKATNTNAWNIPEWKNATEPATIPNSFKQKCSDISGKKVTGTEDPTYQEVVKYCSRDKSMVDRFKEEGLELLSKENKDTEWNNRFDQYKLATNNLKIVGIDIQSTETKETQSSLNKIKDGCHTAASKPVKDSSDSYEAIKKWCSIAKGS